MADEKTQGGAVRRPDAFATLQGYVQGTPEIKQTKEGKEFAQLRMRVPNSQKDADGNWRNDVPSTFVNVSTFNPGQVADIKKGISEGVIKEGSNFRVEGYPRRDTYQKDGVERESWAITPRGGQSAMNFDKPEAGKGLSNEFEIRGAVGKMELHEGEGKNGKPYAFISMSVAHTDDPDWRAKRAGTHEGADRTKTTWYNARISTPKNVEAMKAGMEKGEIGVGAIVSMKAAMVPETWEDRSGNKRETMSFDVKPFADAISVIRAPKPKEQTKEQEAPASASTATKGKKASSKKAAGKKSRSVDDEIPF